MMPETAESSTSLLDQALAYLEQGLSIFPVCTPVPGTSRCLQHERCTSPGKVALVKWKPYQDTRAHPDTVRSWWGRWPEANIAMATGRASGVDVIDLDGDLATRTAVDRGMDVGPWAYTGRVGGRHVWFAHRDDAPTIFAKVGGIDFRGHGGYVLLPPSLHHSGTRYRWADPPTGDPLPTLPRWIDELAAEGHVNGHMPAATGQPLDVEHLIEHGVPEGQRDDTLFRLAAKLRGMGIPYDIAINVVEASAERCTPPFPLDQARAKVDSAYRRYEPNPEPSRPIRLAVPGTVDLATGEVVATDYPVSQISVAMQREPRTDRQVVEGLLWRKRVHWTFSDPGTGKTLWNVALHMHIAANRPFMGRAVQGGPVLFIEEDSPLDTLYDYVDLVADIYHFDLDTLPFYVNDLQGLRITNDQGLARARQAVASCEQKPIAVVLDAAERLVPSDKFNSGELDPLDRFIKGLINEDIVPSIIDHTNRSGRPDKNTKKQQKPDPLALIYGGRAKHAISDIMFFFDGKLRDNGRVNVTWEKFRVAGSAPPPFIIGFNDSTGFILEDHPVQISSPNQMKVRNYLEYNADWHNKQEIIDATGLPEKTVQRALSSLVTGRWAEVHGETSSRAWRFREEALIYLVDAQEGSE